MCVHVHTCMCAYSVDIVARKGLIRKGVTDLKAVREAATCEKCDPGRGTCVGKAYNRNVHAVFQEPQGGQCCWHGISKVENTL